jgi:U32 family peptidase
MVELLVGAGNFPSLIAGVKNGANAIYFGIKGYNMRDLGTNFKISELKKIMNYLHSNNVKGYLALNTIIFENELKKVEQIIKKAKTSNVDAIICSDLAVINLAKKYNLEIHISTQMSISNSIALEQIKKLGAKRVVLARELSLEQIKKIGKTAKKIGIDLECFIHGAMCISVSGRCFLSHELFNKSANKGECLQPCRRAFFLDGDKPNYEHKEILIQGDTILSAKDMKTVEILDKIIKTGVVSLKIEGRTKPSDYIATVTNVYRQAIDSIKNKTYSQEKIQAWNEELEKVYNRKFSKGFFLNKPTKKDLTDIQGSNQKEKRKQIGFVKKYYAKINVCEILLIDELEENQKILIEGKTTYLEQTIDSIQINHSRITKAKKGQLIGIKVSERVRPNDLVYIKTKSNKL